MRLLRCGSGRFLIQVLLVMSIPLSSPGKDRTRLQACVDSCDRAKSGGDHQHALALLDEAFEIAKSLRDSTAMADVLIRRSEVLMFMGDFNRALLDLQDALRIHEARHDEASMAKAYTSIGSIHYYDGNFQRAQQYYRKSLGIFQRVGSRSDVATLLGNLGSVLDEMGHPDSALAYHREHLAMRIASGQRNWLPVCYTNLGVCFDKLGMSDSALHYLEASLALTPDLPDQSSSSRGLALCMLGMARLHAREPRAALGVCKQALAIAQGFGDLSLIAQCYECLYRAHLALGEHERALRMFENQVAVRDSISGEERAKELIRLDLTYNFEREKIQDSLARIDQQRQAEFAYQEHLGRERDQKRIFLFSAIGVLVVAGGLWNRLRFVRKSRNIIRRERDRSERLLLNILPQPIAEELKTSGRARAREVDDVSILFTDFHEFTLMSERMGATELVAEIDTCFRAFDGIAARHRLEKIKTIGDAYMAASGLPEPREGSARDAVLAALGMQEWLCQRAKARRKEGLPYFVMRAGIHTGPVVAGIVGDSKFQYDVWGDTVNTAARMESAGEVGEVNISEATLALVKDEADLQFSPRGRVNAKGKGEMAMFYVKRMDASGPVAETSTAEVA